jgi:predicted transcriptional regulator
MNDTPAPTGTELDLLKLFWREGSLSAREVQDRLPSDLDWAVSTTRTVLERMRAKGLLERRAVHGLAVYQAAHEKVAVIGGVVARLKSLLEINGPLPANALSGSQILSKAEIEALRALLDQDPEDDPS